MRASPARRRTQRYWVAYLLGIPTFFIYTLVWMARRARIAEELKAKAIELGIERPYTPTTSSQVPSHLLYKW